MILKNYEDSRYNRLKKKRLKKISNLDVWQSLHQSNKVS